MTSKKLHLPHVSIIILNWNGWKDTIECLESLFQINYPNYNVIVVDNASTDDSIVKIKNYCCGKIKIRNKYINYNPANKPIRILEYSQEDLELGNFSKEEELLKKLPSNKKIRIIINKRNYMFAVGNNIPIEYYILKKLNSDYILLLNNDTIVENDFLRELIIIAENEKNIGIIGPRICRYDNPEQNEHISLQYIENYPVEKRFISAVAFLIKINVIKTVGLLDPRYIHYYEDVDYCVMARNRGFKVFYYPTKSKVLHKGSISTKKISGLIFYLKERNKILFTRKHFNTKYFFLFLIRYFFKGLLGEFKKRPKEIQYILKGALAGVKLVLKDKALLIHGI